MVDGKKGMAGKKTWIWVSLGVALTVFLTALFVWLAFRRKAGFPRKLSETHSNFKPASIPAVALSGDEDDDTAFVTKMIERFQMDPKKEWENMCALFYHASKSHYEPQSLNEKVLTLAKRWNSTQTEAEYAIDGKTCEFED